MKRTLTLLAACAALGFATPNHAFAQTDGPPGLNPALVKLFGNNNSFTAKAEITLQAVSAKMDFSMLEGKTKVDIDVGQMMGGKMPPATLEQMKQMGMDKMTIITQPEKKSMIMVYPNLQSYAAMEFTDKQAAAAGKDYKMEKTSLGKETLDGHPCEKNKIVLTDDQGEKQEVTSWNASDLKDFPVQLQTAENGKNVTIKFKEIKLARPDAKTFEAPASFTKYDNVQALMQGAMMKKLGGAGAGAK